ncbi:porin family protein [Reichenbachiella sp.]
MKLCLFLLVTLISFRIFGQEAEFSEYIVIRDSLKFIQGEIFYDKTNPNTLNFKKFKNDSFKKYYSDEILEFRLKHGFVYTSEFIDGEYHFLKRLVKDENVLLLWEKKRRSDRVFYLKNDELIRLERQSFNNQIEVILAHKRYGSLIAKKAKYNERSLSRVVIYSNSDHIYYPKFRFGILAGLNTKNYKLEADKTLNFDWEPCFNIGIFIDAPIDIYSPFSARIEAHFSESSHSLFIDDGVRSDYLAKIQSISVPVLLRYRFNIDKQVNFFSNLGPVYTHHFVSNNQVIKVYESPTIIEISELSIPNQMLGGVIGVGAEYPLSHRKDIGFELRYEYLGSIGDIKMTEQAFQVIGTFNF